METYIPLINLFAVLVVNILPTRNGNLALKLINQSERIVNILPTRNGNLKKKGENMFFSQVNILPTRNGN